MTVIFFWTGVTGYMAACWRALAAMPGIKLKLFIEVKRNGSTDYRHAEVLAGLDYDLRFEEESLDRAALRRKVQDLRPDVLVVLGWRCKMCRFVATDRSFGRIPKLFAFDMTFAFTLRKLLARIALRPYLRRFAGAVVTGERSAFYARYLGFRESQLERGLIGIDTALFAAAREARARLPSYPRQFIFVGRYTPEKRLDVLVKAYRLYRSRVRDPWGLTCCGMGPQGALLKGQEGIRDQGFVQPRAMPEIYAEHGALVITSAYDPWPLVIAEAVAAGLPVVCTEACGSHVDFVRSYCNGRVCGTNDVESIAEALVWIHEHESGLAKMGARGMALTALYSKEVWAERWIEICRKVVTRGHRAGSGCNDREHIEHKDNTEGLCVENEFNTEARGHGVEKF